MPKAKAIETLILPQRGRGHALSPAIKSAIASACASGLPKVEVAKRFGCRPETVSRVLRDANVASKAVGIAWNESLQRATANSARTMERSTRKDWRAADAHLRGVGVYGSVSKHQFEGEVVVRLAGDYQPQIHELGSTTTGLIEATTISRDEACLHNIPSTVIDNITTTCSDGPESQ